MVLIMSFTVVCNSDSILPSLKAYTWKLRKEEINIYFKEPEH